MRSDSVSEPIDVAWQPGTFRNECEAVGQCFGTVNNSLSNRSFVSISAGQAVLLQALFHQHLKRHQGTNLPPWRHPH